MSNDIKPTKNAVIEVSLHNHILPQSRREFYSPFVLLLKYKCLYLRRYLLEVVAKVRVSLYVFFFLYISVPVVLSHRSSNSFFLWLLIVMFLCVLLALFSPLVLYQFFCLLINMRRCIHFDFYMITSYLVSVPLFKGLGIWYTVVCLFVSNIDILVSRWVFLHFRFFVLSPLVFVINFVTFFQSHVTLTPHGITSTCLINLK